MLETVLGGFGCRSWRAFLSAREYSKIKRAKGELMSRAEKKLAELKAKEELKKLKAEKREQQQQDWEKTKQQWKALPKGVKTTFKVVGAIIVLFILIGIFSAPDEKKSQDSGQASETTQTTQEANKEEPKPKTAQEIMFEKISGLVDSGKAFDTGSYIKGDIPKGEYAFVPFDGSGQYYSEEDSAGNIVDNENFDSFGYVYVHGVGNIQTKGVLISVGAFEKLGVKSAKEIYEKLNNVNNYKDSAMYKVGTDIKPGSYTIESYGEAYVEVMSGPVGNSEIVNNEIFKGKYSVSVSAGQYLKVSKGKLL